MARSVPKLAYVRDPAHGYVTIAFPVEDGVEVSCWTGAQEILDGA